MKDGLIKVAALSSEVEIANPQKNAEHCISAILRAKEEGAQVIVLPELALSGDTCGDLFHYELLQKECEQALLTLCDKTKELSALIFVGLPLCLEHQLYNVAAVLSGGKLLGFVPKTANSSDESRYFAPAPDENTTILFHGQSVIFGRKLLFACKELPQAVFGAEISEDVWMPHSPSLQLAMAGANVICNLAADNETAGKANFRRSLLKNQSAKLCCGYVYASSGKGESTTDFVFSGHCLVAENGHLLAESKPFGDGFAITEIDCTKIQSLRQKRAGFVSCPKTGYETLIFSLQQEEVSLTRFVDPYPFIPENPSEREERCQEILNIQVHGLVQRLRHTHCKQAVLGLSGGLDSTLALLVTVRAFDLLKLDRKQILAVTMPGFGTTDRTYQNALTLAKELGVTLKEISIVPAVKQHFADIGHDITCHDVTYENSQARERTQILMDLANISGGMVIGTGDLSELALGWATYNGDHMSMYGVNGGIPKTLVRHLVAYEANICENAAVSSALLDVLDTPVSPELLPAKDGEISQKTEDLVGPYELHDFFLYSFVRLGFAPAKIFRFACKAFDSVYDRATIKKWLLIFLRRFFTQQFKRSCLPDGPKVGSVGLSPRGDWKMPSDASAALFLKEAEAIEI